MLVLVLTYGGPEAKANPQPKGQDVRRRWSQQGYRENNAEEDVPESDAEDDEDVSENDLEEARAANDFAEASGHRPTIFSPPAYNPPPAGPQPLFSGVAQYFGVPRAGAYWCRFPKTAQAVPEGHARGPSRFGCGNSSGGRVQGARAPNVPARDRF
ncbi:unnamed protein product, partial [Amoebophrya sp. A120]|eukprot:GSA120T00008536001.1